MADEATLTLFDADVDPLEGPGGRRLTPEQALAVRRREGSLLLEANAGSGKTTVLVERFVHTVVDDEIAPGSILAITFTDKAAGELRERVRRRFVERDERDHARETEAAWISTIHGFCSRVLRSHALAAGLDPAFTVMDEAQARVQQADALDEALRRFVAEHGEEAVGLLAAYGPDRAGRAVTAVHGLLRSRGAEVRLPPVAPAPRPAEERAALVDAARGAAAALEGETGKTNMSALETYVRCGELLGGLRDDELPTPAALKGLATGGKATKAMECGACQAYDEALAAYRAACGTYRATRLWPLADALLRHYAAAYADAKRDAGLLDFDDLELHARDLLRDDAAVRGAVAGRFTRVMVDEFQDTNPLQLEILELLERDNLFVVGDEFQSIYGFRHADVEVFRGRRRALDRAGAVLSLAANFRSEPAILDVLNAAFAPLWPRDFVELRPGGDPVPEPAEPLVELLVTEKAAWDDAVAGGEVDIGDAAGVKQHWRRAEARLVAQRIRDLVDEGESPKDIVVLVRATGSIPAIEHALSDQGLPTAAIGGRGYWSRQQVQDVLSWLRAVANPRDDEALYQALGSPLGDVSPDGVALVALEARRRGHDPWSVLREPGDLLDDLPAEDAAALGAFTERLLAERELAPRTALDQLVLRAATQAGYDLHVLRLPAGARRLANIHKLARLASTYEANAGRDLRGFVDLAIAEEEADARETDAPVELSDLDAVRLMTIHGAKGLEFGVVVVADLGRQGVNDFPDLLVRGDEGGLRVMTLEPGRGEPALEYQRLADEANRVADEEERRVLYVGMTRAERRLILSGSADPEKWPEPKPGAPPISWVGPAFVPGLAGLLAPDAPAVQDLAPHEDRPAARIRLVRNAPSTVGDVLRRESLAPVPEPPGEPAAVPAPAPLPQAVLPPAGASSLSYSALSQYGACGYRYYLERVLRLAPEDEPPAARPAGGMEGRLRGLIVHSLLEHLEFSAPSAPSDDDIAAAAALHGARVWPAATQEVRGLVEAFARSPVCARLAAARDVRREHGFAFTLESDPTHPTAPLITGVVDVRAQEDGRTVVVDYKTDRLAEDADLEESVARAYGVQRRIYALAELRAGAQEVEVVHVFLERADEPVSATFAQTDAATLERELRALGEGIAAARFPVSAEPHRGLCLTCPGRRALCVHPEELTMRETPDPAVGAVSGTAGPPGPP